MLLHFAFYILLNFVGHNRPIGFNYIWRVDSFTFYILHHAIFSLVVINWLSQFEPSVSDAFTFYFLHLATFRGP